MANSGSNSVSVIDTTTNTISTTIAVGSGPLAIAIAPDGVFAYVTNIGNSNVTVIDTTKGRKVDTILVAKYPYSIAITPNGEFAYVVGGSAVFESSVVDLAAGKTIAFIVGIGTAYDRGVAVAITPNGMYAYETGIQTFRVIRITDNQRVAQISDCGPGWGVTITPDGSRAYATESSNSVCVIDTSTNRTIARVPVGRGPRGVAVAAIPKSVSDHVSP